MLYEQKISNFIFSSCLIISIISFTSLVFPALIIETTNSNFNRDVDIFELGAWALPIIFSNVIFIGFYIIYRKDKLPKIINKVIFFINENDISKKTSLIILLILFFIYIVFTIDEFSREEFELGDYKGVFEAAKDYEFGEIGIGPKLKYFFLHVSYLAFDNIRILPFIASISLLLITYFLTLEITKKRFAAVVAFSVLLQSNLFLLFDTTSTYENFWTFFYFLSIYLIFKIPIASPFTFIVSILSKALIITLMPVNLFAITISKISKRNKIFLFVGYSVIVVLILVAASTGKLSHSEKLNFDETNFVSSMNEFGNNMRYEGLIIVSFLPTLLILHSKLGIIREKVNFIFIAISFAILSQPIMNFAIGMTSQPYRLIPLIVFIAIAIGMIFANSKKMDQQ